MKKLGRIFIVFFVSLLFFLAPQTSHAEEVQTIKVGTSGATKPSNYFDDEGNLTGFEPELIRLIDERLPQYEFEFEITEFASLTAGLDAGRLDVITNNLGETAERREKYLFSHYPYVITHNVIITQTGQEENMAMEDFAGKTFGVVAGGPQALFLETWNEENPDLAVDIQYMDTDPGTIIREVYNGRLDATIYATTYLNDVQETFGIELQRHAIENEDAIRPPGSYFLYRSQDPESEELRMAMDEVIADLRDEGILADLSEEFFGEDNTVLTPEMIEKNDRIEAARLQGDTSQESQTVIVGTSGATKPSNFFDEETGELTGYEVELIRLLDEELPQYDFEFEITEFPSLTAGLDSGRLDMIANNLGETEERREKYLFSLYPYVITHNVIITQTGQEENMEMADFAGQSFGVAAGSPQSLFLEEWNEQNPEAAVEIVYSDNTDPGTIIRDVYAGRLDATIYSTTYLNDVENTFGIELQRHPIEDEDKIQPPGSYFLFRKDEPESEELRNAVDEVIAQFREDGTLEALSMEFFGQDNTVLTEDIKEKNDTIEADRLGATGQGVSGEQAATTDGKIFAPEVIIDILPTILSRLPVTLVLTIVSALIGLVLGLLIALIRVNEVPVLNQLAIVFVSFMRGTPQLVQLFLAYYGLPLVVQALNNQFGTNWNVNAIPAVLYVFIAFGLNEAAYNSETFRAAILSVDDKEIEAGLSIGLTNWQTFKRIIMPNAFVVALPNLGNSVISLLKGTSLAYTVTIIDIMGQARIIAGSNLRFFESYIAVALIYWVMCILIEALVRWVEKRMAIGEAPEEVEV